MVQRWERGACFPAFPKWGSPRPCVWTILAGGEASQAVKQGSPEIMGIF